MIWTQSVRNGADSLRVHSVTTSQIKYPLCFSQLARPFTWKNYVLLFYAQNHHVHSTLLWKWTYLLTTYFVSILTYFGMLVVWNFPIVFVWFLFQTFNNSFSFPTCFLDLYVLLTAQIITLILMPAQLYFGWV